MSEYLKEATFAPTLVVPHTNAPTVVHDRKQSTAATIFSVFALLGALAAHDVNAQSPSGKTNTDIPQVKKPKDIDESPDIARIRGELKNMILRWGHEEFAVRQEATEECNTMIEGIVRTENPVPDKKREVFEKVRSLAKTREQVSRLEDAISILQEREAEFPKTIPVGEYELDEVLMLIEQQTGFEILIDPEIGSQAAKQRITVEAGKNDFAAVLSKICLITEGTIEFDKNPRALRIIPKNQTQKKFFTSGIFVGLIGSTSWDPKQDNVELRQTPDSGKIISITGATTGRHNVNQTQITQLTLPMRPIFDMTRKPIWSRSTLESDKMDIDDLKLRCIKLTNPSTVTIPCNGVPKNIGVQNISITSKNLGKTTEVTIVIGVSDDNPRANGPCDSEHGLLGLIDANRYTLYDNTGEPITANIDAWYKHKDRNKLCITLICDKNPVEVCVDAYQDISFDENVLITLPADDQSH